jgi:hypothetical protein
LLADEGLRVLGDEFQQLDVSAVASSFSALKPLSFSAFTTSASSKAA